jgi:hypothetical protein
MLAHIQYKRYNEQQQCKEDDPMAVQEHVERLTRSIDEWNQWRREQPDVQPDLSLANLTRADLNSADLRETNFSCAHLSGANLTGANLDGAILFEADLYKADLTGANLNGAYLNSADLVETRFLFTKLRNAHFYDAQFLWTIFVGTDVSSVEGLETVLHAGRSVVDINSVVLPSEEHILKPFLRGVGFTETQIEYLPSLLTPRPIQYYSVFISYAHQDEAVAKRLDTDLRKKDVPCWFAPHDLKIGDKIRHRIDECIHLQEKFLLILSEHSVASQWVEHEVETALGKERESQPNVLFPLRLDDAVLKSTTGWASHIRLTRHIGDFTNFQDDAAYQKAFATLLRDLKVNKPPMK